MRRFAGISAVLSFVMVMTMFCACHKPKETTATSTETSPAESQTVTSQTSSETSATSTSSQPVTDTTVTVPSDSSESSALTSPSQTASTTAEKIKTAKGKYDYVLKNKDWKYDGEMYYHKYSNGIVAYYDKETKSYFLIDSKGQGWYYDSEIGDFVKDD